MNALTYALVLLTGALTPVSDAAPRIRGSRRRLEPDVIVTAAAGEGLLVGDDCPVWGDCLSQCCSDGVGQGCLSLEGTCCEHDGEGTATNCEAELDCAGVPNGGKVSLTFAEGFCVYVVYLTSEPASPVDFGGD